MNEGILIAMIAAIPGIATGLFAYLQSGKASEKAIRSEYTKVEAGAYERARKLYEDGIRQLEEQLDRLKIQLRDEQDVSNKMRRQIGELEDTVYVLRQQLIRSGIELSPQLEKLP